jgi:hypothetical protein
MEKWELLKLGRVYITTFTPQGRNVQDLKDFLRFRDARPKAVMPTTEELMDSAIVPLLIDGWEPMESVVDRDGALYYYLFRRKV